MPEGLSRNRFDVILQYDWSIEQCLLHIRVFFGGKTKSPCFVHFIHWLIKQITNTYGNHFSRSYENRSNYCRRATGKSNPSQFELRALLLMALKADKLPLKRSKLPVVTTRFER